MSQQQEHMEQGTVEAVNDRGVKVGGAWWNFSKFSEVAHPQVGQEVQLLIRGDKWVQACKVLGTDGQVDDGESFGSGGQDDDPGSWGYGSTTSTPSVPRRATPVPAPPAPAPKSGPATLRAAALAASAHFYSAHEVDEAVVYDTAARFLAWIESED